MAALIEAELLSTPLGQEEVANLARFSKAPREMEGNGARLVNRAVMGARKRVLGLGLGLRRGRRRLVEEGRAMSGESWGFEEAADL